jgi:phage gp16-like protein
MWYGDSELADCRHECKGTIFVMRLAKETSTAIDPSLFCVVGLEKFCNWRQRDQARKLLIKSVIAQQHLNRSLGRPHETHSIRCISETMSRAFLDSALWQAAHQEAHAFGSSPPQCQKVMKRKIIESAGCIEGREKIKAPRGDRLEMEGM